MKCPHCNINLLLSEKQGVEIDYCPDCRGVWLDRGELEKIVERSNQSFGSFSTKQPNYEKQQYEKPHYENKHYDNRGNDKHRRKSFLEDIFDF